MAYEHTASLGAVMTESQAEEEGLAVSNWPAHLNYDASDSPAYITDAFSPEDRLEFRLDHYRKPSKYSRLSSAIANLRVADTVQRLRLWLGAVDELIQDASLTSYTERSVALAALAQGSALGIGLAEKRVRIQFSTENIISLLGVAMFGRKRDQLYAISVVREVTIKALGRQWHKERDPQVYQLLAELENRGTSYRKVRVHQQSNEVRRSRWSSNEVADAEDGFASVQVRDVVEA